MKKVAIAVALLSVIGTASAASVGLGLDFVRDRGTKAQSTAQVVRVDGTYKGLDVGLSTRTTTLDAGGLKSAIEGTLGMKAGPLRAYGGVGHDNGANGAVGKDFQYGVVGLGGGFNLGPISTFTGVRTRVNWDKDAPKQTLVHTGVSYALDKTHSVGVGVSRSYSDIRENGVMASWNIRF